MPSVYMGAKYLNSDPHASMTSMLISDLALQPFIPMLVKERSPQVKAPVQHLAIILERWHCHMRMYGVCICMCVCVYVCLCVCDYFPSQNNEFKSDIS